ncbi:hypothetical protein Acr_12g0000960 [Actinidia rufa]|uniref:Uncharacterized protein n=1 Tax=Actinidia rufa TaxID=165716 RepID=A0A7J0FFX2_9ERIC|nr:hypothetical protein Acr_12g0000960 [Actinidia rufa]
MPGSISSPISSPAPLPVSNPSGSISGSSPASLSLPSTSIHPIITRSKSVAMDEEYGALIKPETWSLVPVPPQDQLLLKIISLACIGSIKLNDTMMACIARYKARLVAATYADADWADDRVDRGLDGDKWQ